MATEFKRISRTNIGTTTSIPATASWQVADASTNDPIDIYRPAPTVDAVVLGLLLTNTSGSSITADVAIVTTADGGGNADNVHLIKGAQIPVGSALEVISGKVVLANTHASTAANGDRLQIRCSAADSMDATLSILENTP